MMRSVVMFLLGLVGGIIVMRVVLRMLDTPPAPPKTPPAYKPIVTDAELAARDRQVRECKSRGGTPVMGFNFTAVCVKEFK